MLAHQFREVETLEALLHARLGDTLAYATRTWLLDADFIYEDVEATAQFSLNEGGNNLKGLVVWRHVVKNRTNRALTYRQEVSFENMKPGCRDVNCQKVVVKRLHGNPMELQERELKKVSEHEGSKTFEAAVDLDPGEVVTLESTFYVRAAREDNFLFRVRYPASRLRMDLSLPDGYVIQSVTPYHPLKDEPETRWGGRGERRIFSDSRRSISITTGLMPAQGVDMCWAPQR